MRLARALGALGAVLGALVPAGDAAAASVPTEPVYDEAGRLVDTPFVPSTEGPLLTERRATRIFLADPRVAGWLDRYPPDPQTDADFDRKSGNWTVRVWSGRAGQVAEGRVDDLAETVEDVRTGPQVAWSMARGSWRAFGGRTINEPAVWLVLCAVFLLGLVDWRRPLRLRNLDLVVLLLFTASLWFFNEGRIFWSAPLAYPPLLYLLARMLWIGLRGRAEPPARPTWPIWLLAGATVFLVGFRAGLNVQAERSVIDVGYAGVVGAQRILDGQAPYGNMPTRDSRLDPCGPAGSDGVVDDRIQTNGRCEHANERGDTYGPVSYLAYVPGVAALGWSGDWDTLPAAHLTALLFDLLCLLGLALVGRRFGGNRLAATLAFAWAAYPFTQYVSNSNTNDAIMPAFLIWGFLLLSHAWARGAAVALAGWTKFAALLVAPLWLTYPDGLRLPRLGRFALGFGAATLAAFAILLLEPDVVEAARTFADRTLGFQLDRESPFSIWGWGQYHAAGIPDLHWPQRVLEVAVVALAVAVAFVPRRKTPLQLAALTAALLIGFEVVLTHWFYLYIPWFFPFVAFAVLSARARVPPVH